MGAARAAAGTQLLHPLLHWAHGIAVLDTWGCRILVHSCAITMGASSKKCEVCLWASCAGLSGLPQARGIDDACGLPMQTCFNLYRQKKGIFVGFSCRPASTFTGLGKSQGRRQGLWASHADLVQFYRPGTKGFVGYPCTPGSTFAGQGKG
eukprot:1158443-Pelagomonas_calceolata.AAC.1